jgi:MFS family permease
MPIRLMSLEFECLDGLIGSDCAEFVTHLAIRHIGRTNRSVRSNLISMQSTCLTAISFVMICGLGSGGYFSLQSSIVSQIIGSHRLNYGIGWLEVAQSLGYLAGPISAGALLDAFGGAGKGAAPYRPAMVSRVTALWDKRG